MNRTIVHSLCFNLPSEVAETTRRLREQNPDGYEHYLIDLDFPLEKGDEIPEDIPKAQLENSYYLMDIAEQYGINYLKFRNIGCSQNWSSVIKQTQVQPGDCIIGQDVDEVTIDAGYVDAMKKVLLSDNKIALCSLMMTDMEAGFKERFAKQIQEVIIDGIRCYIVDGLLSWALIGLSGEFLQKINYEIPFPAKAERYGWIESVLYPLIKQHGYRWVILPDYRVTHTNNVPLYRQWKDRIVFKVDKGQPSFEEFLVAKREGLDI